MKNIIFFILFAGIISCINPGLQKKESININNYNAPVNVRVLILEGSKFFSLSSDGDFYIKEGPLNLKKISGKKIILKSEDVTIPLEILPEKDFIKLNGIPYRGSVQIRNSGGKLLAVNHLNIEEYLLSVVAGEIPSSWPMEALKAQAVAARTYAYHHIENSKNKKTFYELKATTSSQLYKGSASERNETTKAVKETAGVIMTYKDQSIISFFHSSCGGRTADYKTVWNIKNLDYLEQVECNYCSRSPDYEWETSLSMNEIKNKIKKLYSFEGKINVITFERESGRISEVSIKHDKGIIYLSGNKFRLLFEPKKIRSLNFISKKSKTGIMLKGKGWGHGVGMCQWGAKGLSLAGTEYRDILKYYFKKVEFRNFNLGIALN